MHIDDGTIVTLALVVLTDHATCTFASRFG